MRQALARPPVERGAGRRPIRRVVRLSVEEDAELQRRAGTDGVTVVRYMVEAALGERSGVRKGWTLALTGACRMAVPMVTNINQIARVANASGVVTDVDLAAVAAEAHAVVDLLRDGLAVSRS